MDPVTFAILAIHDHIKELSSTADETFLAIEQVLCALIITIGFCGQAAHRVRNDYTTESEVLYKKLRREDAAEENHKISTEHSVHVRRMLAKGLVLAFGTINVDITQTEAERAVARFFPAKLQDVADATPFPATKEEGEAMADQFMRKKKKKEPAAATGSPEDEPDVYNLGSPVVPSAPTAPAPAPAPTAADDADPVPKRQKRAKHSPLADKDEDVVWLCTINPDSIQKVKVVELKPKVLGLTAFAKYAIEQHPELISAFKVKMKTAYARFTPLNRFTVFSCASHND